MESVAAADIPDGSLLAIDTPPIIYVLEEHPSLARRFIPLFEAHAQGRLEFSISALVIAEVLTGPFAAHNEALAERYREVLSSWRVVPVDAALAERAARLRAAHGLKLADAIQLAAALASGAYCLVTHDRDFSKVTGIRVLT